MITTGFESRVKIQQIVDNQLPEFILSESPKAVDFLKQYYVSQEFQGAPVDIAENLDQYLNLNNLTPEVISGFTSTTSALSPTDTTVSPGSKRTSSSPLQIAIKFSNGISGKKEGTYCFKSDANSWISSSSAVSKESNSLRKVW